MITESDRVNKRTLLEKEMATHSSVLAWRGSLMGCRLWGHRESGTIELT